MSNSRQLDLRLSPNCPRAALELHTIVWTRESGLGMGRVTLSARAFPFDLQFDLVPDEARVLANQLLQCADAADDQRAAIAEAAGRPS